MTTFRSALILMCLVLAACGDIKQRAVPTLEDDPRVFERALAELSPWEDGSPDRSNDGRTPGDPNSDRQLFARWMYRYAAHETYKQYDRDYQPFAVPGTISEAIEEQRQYEAQTAARLNQEQQQQRQQEAAFAAQRRVQQEQTQAAQAAQDALYAQQEAHYKAESDAASAQYRQEQAEQERRMRADAAEGVRNYECRMAREKAYDEAVARAPLTIPGCRSASATASAAPKTDRRVVA